MTHNWMQILLRQLVVSSVGFLAIISVTHGAAQDLQKLPSLARETSGPMTVEVLALEFYDDPKSTEVCSKLREKGARLVGLMYKVVGKEGINAWPELPDVYGSGAMCGEGGGEGFIAAVEAGTKFTTVTIIVKEAEIDTWRTIGSYKTDVPPYTSQLSKKVGGLCFNVSGTEHQALDINLNDNVFPDCDMQVAFSKDGEPRPLTLDKARHVFWANTSLEPHMQYDVQMRRRSPEHVFTFPNLKINPPSPKAANGRHYFQWIGFQK